MSTLHHGDPPVFDPSIVAVVDPVIVGESMVSSTLFSSASEGMPISVICFFSGSVLYLTEFDSMLVLM